MVYLRRSRPEIRNSEGEASGPGTIYFAHYCVEQYQDDSPSTPHVFNYAGYLDLLGSDRARRDVSR